MDKCPFCGAETRPGDNFCLNCGNRLVPASSSPQQVQPTFGDATLPAQEDWAAAQGTIPASPMPSWANASEPTIANTDVEPATMRSDNGSSVGQATMDRVENPAHFILRAENGSVVKEFPLDKLEMSIGRAPNSDILLSKDKLTSRRHATVHYENENYMIRDEHSANGTFVNGQQLEEMGTATLNDGDHIGIGEHELVFRAFGSVAPDVEDLPTISVPYDNMAGEMTYQTRDDELATNSSIEDDYGTKVMNGDHAVPPTPEPVSEPPVETPSAPVPAFAAEATSLQSPPPPAPQPVPTPAPAPVPVAPTVPVAPAAVSAATSTPLTPVAPLPNDPGVNFGRITALPTPTLPDIAPLTAALSALDGQVMSLQEQLNTTQEALRNHESEVNQITNQLRTGVRRVSDRMDNTIADVARKREELSWAELLQLMEDVENNPRDIEYVTKLARKARELRKVFQMHQNVLSTMAECNSLLRGLIGEER